jgi:DNA polymerase-3 subunit beta
MKIECPKDSLQKAVAIADKITGRNLSLPILSCILLSAKNKVLTVKATNLDLGVEFYIPVKVVTEGDVAIPSNIFSSYLSNSQSRSIVLEEKDGVLNVTSQNGKTSIKTQNHEDFPIIPRIPKDKKFDIQAADFISGMKAVWYAASPSSIKPELSSVYIYSNNNKLTFVATDSFRLAEKQLPVVIKGDFPPLLIPFKNIPEIIRTLENTGEVEIAITKNQISFSNQDFYLTSRVVEGMFPDYKQIIPKQTVTEATILKEDIMNTLHVSNIFTDKFNKISFSIQPKSKIFEIRSKNSDLGDSAEKVSAAITGDELDIDFNYRYLTDAFQSLHADSVSFAFSGLQKPLVIRGVGDQSFLYLVMPMNR